MAQQERKEREQRSRTDEPQQAMQRSGSRHEGRWRDPFAAFFGGRDPFASFWEPFGLVGRSSWPFQTGRSRGMGLWSPQIETFQRGDEFVVRADLPGLTKDDVKVDITDDSITIEGERRDEHDEDREGYYRSERSYGSFYRAVPLPEGAITDDATAQFNQGVLEVVVKVPPREVSRGRRLEISESNERTKTR